MSIKFGVNSIKGNRDGPNEDRHIIVHETLPNIGSIQLYGVFDGHGGADASETLEEKAWPILRRALTHVSNHTDEAGIIAALRDANCKFKEEMPETSGTTVTMCLIVQKDETTSTAFNLTIGDGRYNFFDKTGKTILTNIRKVDFETNEDIREECLAVNRIHQINGSVYRRDGTQIIRRREFVNPDVLKEYAIRGDDEKETYWKEWVTWNLCKDANPSKIIKYPRFDANAWRMDDLQPTRSMGKNERAINMGELWVFDFPNTTMLTVCCDGVDDNGATRQTSDNVDEPTFQECIIDFHKADRSFFSKHYAVPEQRPVEWNKPTPAYPEGYPQKPDGEASFFTKMEWTAGLLKPGAPYATSTDESWDNGTKEALAYFKGKIGMQIDYTQVQEMAEVMTYYCSLRFSADNVSLIYVLFDSSVHTTPPIPYVFLE